MCESKISKKFTTVMTAESDYNNNAVLIWSDQSFMEDPLAARNLRESGYNKIELCDVQFNNLR
jgi:hypothetical protein